MQNINLLPKRPYVQRFALFIMFVVVLVGGGCFAYMYFESSFIEDEASRIERNIAHLQHDVIQLQSRLEEVQSIKDEIEKGHEIAQLKNNRLRWVPLLDTIFNPGDEVGQLNMTHLDYSDMTLHMQIKFTSYEQLQRYEQYLLRSPFIHFVDIHRTSLSNIMIEQREYTGHMTVYLQR